MKQINGKLIAVMLAAAILLGQGLYAQTKKADKYSEIKIKTSSQCGMCKETIEKAMAFEKGVLNRQVTLEFI